jgi:glycosyltransferase involved in cell wall biosynthesis
MNQRISIVVPAYNEAENLPVLAAEISKVLSAFDYEIIVVNDGSKDNSLSVLKQLNQADNRIQYVSLSRNFGHQKALRCGLSFATGDAIISMDADLQHPPAMLPKLIEAWKSGCDVVVTQKVLNNNLPLLKRFSTFLFYKAINLISDVNIEHGAADFRLLDKKVVDVINKTPESDLFLRGYVEWVGFKKSVVAYTPAERFSGTAQYSWSKLFALALNGITSFSIKPLRVSAVIGAFISFLAFCYAIYAIYIFFFTDKAVTGWASLLVSMLFLGGLQLLMIGILGEYIGKIFIQSKGRPDYVVREKSL